MGYARLLNYGDVNQFKELIARKFHAKEIKGPDSDQKFLNDLERSGVENIRVYGYFDDNDELLSSSCQYLWKRMPYYTMMWGLIHPKFLGTPFNISVSVSGARESFDEAVRYGESIDRYTFYYGMTLRNLKTRRDLWLKEDSYLTQNYDRHIETVIKSGHDTDYEPWKAIIGFHPRQQDIVIKVCRKKPDLLHKILYDKNLIDVDYKTLYN